MLDAVVSRVITKTLKDYIEEMNSSQTQMKLWKGFATFDDVTLKETALSKHDLPLVIRRGKIGHKYGQLFARNAGSDEGFESPMDYGASGT